MTRLAVRLAGLLALAAPCFAAEIPRAEHPRPEATRAHWLNLNGKWDFRFDPADEGLTAGWFKPRAAGFDKTIVVPFPWESELSGIQELKGPKVAWYRRTFEVPATFPKGQRTWLRFEAVDYRADVWVDGKKVAEHEGGYSPFEADISDAITPGKAAVVVVRAFDPTDPELPTGKQVGWYTPTSGIWQTVWLESRPTVRIGRFVATTTVDPPSVSYKVQILGLKAGDLFNLTIPNILLVEQGQQVLSMNVTSKGEAKGPDFESTVVCKFDPNQPVRPKLWTPESPNLYDHDLVLSGPDGAVDKVSTYFGLRTIARGKYGDSPYERLLLNGKPIYLRAALDQSFNPKGIYTAPDDDFLKRDLLIAKYNGLNGLRIHIKPDEPRRLYWADKIGILILEDMPNTWKQSPRARAAWESTMREVVVRDRNHPSIVAWIAFNETWGLGESEAYKRDKDTQAWVKRMVSAIRGLDPTRLVEDNSPCNFDHVEGSDLNSWHFYIDEYAGAKRHIADVVARTTPGSAFNFCPGEKQSTAPLINSEYGGVSAGGGDRDVSWSFRDLTTQLRRQPKIQGYVYTELTDIEWEHNGFFNYDRTPKDFGFEAFIPGLHTVELQGADFVGFDSPPVIVGKPGEFITVPVFISHFSDLKFEPTLRWWLDGVDDRGDLIVASSPRSVPATWIKYDVKDQAPIRVKLPDRPFVGSLNLTLRDPENGRFAANFVNIVVRPEKPLPWAERDRDDVRDAVLRFAPTDFAKKSWTRTGNPPAGKAYGYGVGFFEYHIKVPEAVVKAGVESYQFQFEGASKAERQKVDWAERKSKQDYPQTDEKKWWSAVEISINGKVLHRDELEDDPADARGVLSHMARVEHGSHGDLIAAAGELPDTIRADIEAGKPLIIRLSVPVAALHAGGLCVFGAETGRYPFDPTLILHTRDALPAGLNVPPDQPVAIDVAVSKVVQILPAGDSTRVRPSTWAYSTETPAASWTSPDFDDSAWRQGAAGFGQTDTPGVNVRTRWDSPSIWLRTQVDVPKVDAGDALILHLFHDEDVEVFVNGRSLFRAEGFVTDYLDVPLDDRQKALFHSGKNTIAVSCRQTRGGQGVDLGLNLDRSDR